MSLSGLIGMILCEWHYKNIAYILEKKNQNFEMCVFEGWSVHNAWMRI